MVRKRGQDDSDSDSNDDGESTRGLVKRSKPSGSRLSLDGSARQSRETGHTASSYTIAWICAIAYELAAARAMLDETYPPLLDQPLEDSNNYTLGSICGHNVAIACLPASQYGNVNAAAVLTNLQRTFPKIRVCMMVGVGGGVPGPGNDIRLGDVVVGIRVMPYELGKIGRRGRIRRMGGSLMPHPMLSTLLSTIRAKHESEPSRVPSIIQERFSSTPEYRHPDLPDRLFEAAYDHVSSPGGVSQCRECDESRVIARSERTSTIPEIHYGAIGSGDKLIKHGLARDELARKLNVICFEMEAAGLMSVLPCLPIRGICDYSDSHKNKAWQRYAAAAAAAYAREILELLPVVSSKTPTEKHTIPTSPDEHVLRDRRNLLMSSLPFPQLDMRRQAIAKAHAETCKWLLQAPEYQQWNDPDQQREHHGFLWIRGKPGVGKSTMMKFIFDQARRSNQRASGKHLNLSFFFHARGSPLEKSVTGMYRSLLVQLLEHFTDLQSVIDNEPDAIPRNKVDCPPVGVLKDLLRTAVICLGNERSLTCFVDALDEGDEQQIIEMVQFFEEVAEQTSGNGVRFKMCFSSRHYPYIDIHYGLRFTMEDQAGHTVDLSSYIQSNLRVKDAQMLADIESQLVQKSGRVFLWVKIVVDILNTELRRGGLALRKRLAEIPEGLSNLFRNILTRDNHNIDSLLLSISWVLFAKRQLCPLELYHALWAGLAMRDQADKEMPNTAAGDAEERAKRCILSSSKGLVEVTGHGEPTVQFIHESVRDFLIRDGGLGELWPQMGTDWEAQSHETLKLCCRYYLHHQPVAQLIKEPSTNDFKAMSFTDAERLRSTIPLLEYASQYMLSHADAAAKSFCQPQEELLASQSSVSWTRLLKMSQRYAFRYSPTASLMYILADRGLSHLIRIWMRREPPHRREESTHETYRYPFFAAVAQKDANVVAALLGTDSSDTYFTDVVAGLERHNDACRRLSPLSWAVSEELLGVVSLLLRQGVDANEKDPAGVLPLVRVWSGGHHGAAKGLIKLRAENRLRHIQGQTPLRLAVPEKREGIVGLLLRHGARADSTDGEGQTPLQLAVQENNEGMVGLLLRHGASVDGTGGKWQTPLHQAAEGNNEGMVSFLLRHGARVDSIDGVGQTPLHRAVEGNNKSMVSFLLRQGARVDSTDRGRQTPLHWASYGKNFGIVRALVDSGSDIYARDANMQTPLHIATNSVWKDAGPVISLLVGDGSHINTANHVRKTPLHQAVLLSRPDVVELLLCHGAYVDPRDMFEKTPLHYACIRPDEGTVSLLLARGANVNAQDASQATPLLLAVAHKQHHTVRTLLTQSGLDLEAPDVTGRSALVAAYAVRNLVSFTMLLERGARIDTHDEDHRTPLHMACADGSDEFVRRLLEQGASVDVRDKDDETPLHRAVAASHYESLKMLLKQGASISARDKDDRTPLHKACYFGDDESVQMLLEKGASVNARDKNDITPLHEACTNGDDEIVQMLLEKGASVNVRDKDDRTPLHEVCAYGPSNIVRMLLEKGASIDVRDKDDRTPLHEACAYGSSNIVRMLLEQGASIDVRDKDDRTPLHEACSDGYDFGTVRMLLEQGASIDVRDKDERTPLHETCTDGDDKIVRVLLEQGASVDARDKDSSTPCT